MRRAMNWIAAIVSLGMAHLALVDHLAAQTTPSAAASAPRIEDYATIESTVGGVPVFSFGNLVYVYGQSPDLLPGAVMQRGNTNPVVKIRPKKSWEIKHNLAGSEHEMTVRSAWTDSHPTLPIHLIDGDPETVWSSWGCAVPDGRPEWIRIDLPLEAEVASVVLVCAKQFSKRYPPHGKALPKQIEVKLSRDGAVWETVYDNKALTGDPSGRTELKFAPRRAKQIWVLARHFLQQASSLGYIFSLGELEVRDRAGTNLALISRGAGVTVSSTSYGLLNDRITQDLLWGPLQYDLGNTWVRVGPDNGSFTWNYVEIEKGRLAIDPRADQSITECVRNGIHVIMVLDFKGNWRYQNPPRKTDWREARYREFNDNYTDSPGHFFQNAEMKAGYLRYVEYMVRHFQDRVSIFELGNEWNAWFSPEQYVKEVFEPTFAVVKKAAPEAKVMLGNPAGFDAGAILACLGWPAQSGIRDGKFLARGGNTDNVKTCTLVVADKVRTKDVSVGIDARNVGQSGILLRYKDLDNFLLATYVPHMNAIFFHERIGGRWGQILAPVPIPAFGPELHLAAKVQGPRATFTVSDGVRQATTKHTVRQLNDTGAVGFTQLTLGDQFTFSGQAFDNFEVLDGAGKPILREEFNGANGTISAGLKYVSDPPHRDSVPPGIGPRIDGIGWHPGNYPDKEYFKGVRRLKAMCETLGFKGRYYATEIYAGSSYPPGQPTEMQMAKYLVRSLTGHSGLDMEAGPCHPHFTAFPHPQSLCRQTWPVQTLVPCQPSITYYAWRTLATVLDDFYPAEYPVSFSAKDSPTCFTFESGDKKQRLLAAWLPVADADETRSLECDAVLPGVRAQKAWGIDIFNGTEQELAMERKDSDTVFKGVLVKDYPTYLRIRK